MTQQHEPASTAPAGETAPTSATSILPLPTANHPAISNTEVWHPSTVLSTLPHPPRTSTTSPLPFFHLLERLKTTPREGWRRFGIAHGESIADHMYRMSIITLLCPPTLAATLDLSRCTRMALVHDMAEALVGDITPVDGVSKSEKSRREAETMDHICQELLGKVGGGVAGQGIKDVWWEYEEGETRESRFVHDVDKIELLLQMVEYERAREGKLDLGEFAWVKGKIEMREVREWAEELLGERERWWVGVRERLGLGGEAGKVGGLSERRVEQQEEYYGRGSGEANGEAK